jgi:hypothetical protein
MKAKANEMKWQWQWHQRIEASGGIESGIISNEMKIMAIIEIMK